MNEDETMLEHLKMVQNVITRMAQNSFQLKTLAATLVAGVLALIGATNNPSPLVPGAAIFPLLLFWILDARYLTLEQKYRDLFNDIRKGIHPPNYDLNYSNAVFAFRRTDLSNLISWSVMWYYLPMLALMGAISFLQK